MKRKRVRDTSISKCSKENTGSQSSSLSPSRTVLPKTYYFRTTSGALIGEDTYKSDTCMNTSSFSTSISFPLPVSWLVHKLYRECLSQPSRQVYCSY